MSEATPTTHQAAFRGRIQSYFYGLTHTQDTFASIDEFERATGFRLGGIERAWDGLQVAPENLTVLAPHRALLAARPLFLILCAGTEAPCKPSNLQRDRNECIALTDRPCL